jgi:hypothetical protein
MLRLLVLPCFNGTIVFSIPLLPKYIISPSVDFMANWQIKRSRKLNLNKTFHTLRCAENYYSIIQNITFFSNSHHFKYSENFSFFNMLTKQSSKSQHPRGPLQGYRTTMVLFPYLQPFHLEGSAIRRCAEQCCEFEPCDTSPVSSNAFDDF